MNIRAKLLVVGTAVTLLSILLASYLIGRTTLGSARETLNAAAQDRLVALRETRKVQIEDYFSTLVVETQSLSRSTVASDAIRALRPAVATVVRELGGDAKIATLRPAVAEYYAKEVTAEFTKRNLGAPPNFADAVEKLDLTGLVLQHQYVAANPNPIGQKSKLPAADASVYSRAHAQIHSNMIATQTRLGLQDLLFIDAESRRVVYSTAKGGDFGVLLESGAAAKTAMAEVALKALASKSAEDVFVADFTAYQPANNAWSAFIAVPVFDRETLLGATVIVIPADRLNGIMTGDRKWVEIGLGETGQSILVGSDKLARSEIRFMVEGREAWLNANAERFGAARVEAMRKKNTAVGLFSIGTDAVTRALAGETGVMVYQGLRSEVAGAYTPFTFRGIKWALVVNQDAQEVYAAADSLQTKSIQTAVITALILSALVSLLILFFVEKFTSPIAQLQSTVVKVAGGDFSARSDIKTNDEMGTLGSALNNLLDERINAAQKAERENEQLNNSVIGLLTTVAELSQRDLTVRAPVTEDILGTVGDSINQMTDATVGVMRDVTKIAGVVEHASKRVKQQSDAVNTVAASERMSVNRLVHSLQQATASMQDVSRLAQDSNTAAAEASTNTESAMATVATTAKGMDAIRETISEMEKRIKRLGERSQEISQIVNLINTISERTHVLSLNASMQAAMAGEAGRGFAVVAEEVQRLAENSRQATAQISTLVQNIQIETNDTIGTVNRTIGQVVQGSEQARESGVKMREAQNSTARLVEMVQTIARSTQSQVALAGQLEAAAGEITASTKETAEQLTQQNQVTNSLVTASQKLVESVSVFKLPQAS